MKYKTQFTHREFKHDNEVNTQPSMTVPDQSLSVKELMERYAKGLPLEGEKVSYYHGEEFVPDLKKMDLSEIDDLKAQNAENIINMQKDIQAKRKSAAEKKQRELWEKEQKEKESTPPAASAGGDAK